MLTLELLRRTQTPDGTFGVLSLGGTPLVFTCEDDWLENAKGQSCIPAGEYILRPTIFQRHNLATWEVTGVPNRSRILVHPGNTEEDSEGCILVGTEFGKLPIAVDEDTGAKHVIKQGVVHSREAFAKFMAALNGHAAVRLIIAWAAGLPKPVV